jgi:hypothetical protein
MKMITVTAAMAIEGGMDEATATHRQQQQWQLKAQHRG